MEEIRESNESPTLSYNYFLYQKRKEKGFSRRKFARYINVPIIRYRLVEQGYLKPSKKDILSISQQLNVDYNAYLEGFNGYPTEIPPKLQGKFAKKIFNLLGKTSLRIVALVFTVLFLFMFIGSQIAQSYYDKRPTFFYNETLVEFQNKIEEKGSPNFSLTGKFRYPQVAITDRDNINNTAILTQITSIYLKEEFKLGFIMVYWSDTYRYYLKLNEMIGTDGKYILDAYDYGTSTLYSGTYIDSGEGIIEFKSAPEDLINNFKAFISGININSKFDKVIKDKLNLDVVSGKAPDILIGD